MECYRAPWTIQNGQRFQVVKGIRTPKTDLYYVFSTRQWTSTGVDSLERFLCDGFI
jgi:hypothetical protein